METHKIKGNFSKKYWNDEKEREISFPSTLAELAILAKAGSLKVDGKDFKLDEKGICQWAYRGFSLQHQGAEPMDEDQKKAAKEKRVAASSTVKAFSLIPKDKQEEIIKTLESAGHDCSAMRAAYSLPK